MNLGYYMYLVRRWALLAIVPAVLLAVLIYAYTARQPKVYQTTAQLYVQVASSLGSGNLGGTDVYSSEAVIPTYTQILNAPFIAQRVDQAMAGQYPGYRLESHGLSVGAAGSTTQSGQPLQVTQLMNISVTDTIPARAAAAADVVANVFISFINQDQEQHFQGTEQSLKKQIAAVQGNIQVASARISSYQGSPGGLNDLKAALTAYSTFYQNLLLTQQQIGIARDTARHGVRLLSPAPVPTSPIAPKPVQPALIVGFVTLLLFGAGIYAYDYLDDTPRGPDEIEEIAGAPILGTVPSFRSSRKGSPAVSMLSGRSPLAEAYRIIRTNLQFINIDNPPRVLTVTSAGPSEGKSTTASNLAHMFAEGGQEVTLIDADLRRPSLHRIFDKERNVGLTNLLVGSDQLNGQGVQFTDEPNLSLIVSGPVPPRPAELLGTARMRDLVSHLRATSDMVILDSPPCLAVTDPAVLSTIADGVILVVDPAKSKRRELRRAREAIEVVGGKIVGVVINRLARRGTGHYYYYYSHSYDYRYKEAEPASV